MTSGDLGQPIDPMPHRRVSASEAADRRRRADAASRDGGADGLTREVEVARRQLVLADPAPSPARRRTLALIDAAAENGVSPLDRSHRPGHVTCSALVVDSDGERFVLLHHAKLGIWVQPGGHVDGSGDLAIEALREATEETGISGLEVVEPAIDLDIHRVDPPSEDAHDHHDLRFLVIAPPDARLAANEESTDATWVAFDEVDELDVDEGVRRLARAGRQVLSTLSDG